MPHSFPTRRSAGLRHDTVSGLLSGSQGSPLNESVSSSSLAVRLSAPAPASSPVGDASLELAPASLSTFLPGVAPAVPSTSADADSADAVEAGASFALRRSSTRMRACALLRIEIGRAHV